MTYRDDTEAALARADALAAELERSEKERERLAAELEELRHPKPRALATREKPTLARRVERGLATRTGELKSVAFIGVLAFVCGAVVAIPLMPLGVILLLVGLAVFVLAAQRLGNRTIATVMHAFAEKPETVTSLHVTSGGVYIGVGERKALCASRAPYELGDELAAACPKAVLTRENDIVMRTRSHR